MSTVICIKDTIGFKKGEVFPDTFDMVYGRHKTRNNDIFWREFPEYFSEVDIRECELMSEGDFYKLPDKKNTFKLNN